MTAFNTPLYEQPSAWAGTALPSPTTGLAVQSMATVLEDLDSEAAEAADGRTGEEIKPGALSGSAPETASQSTARRSTREAAVPKEWERGRPSGDDRASRAWADALSRQPG